MWNALAVLVLWKQNARGNIVPGWNGTLGFDALQNYPPRMATWPTRRLGIRPAASSWNAPIKLSGFGDQKKVVIEARV